MAAEGSPACCWARRETTTATCSCSAPGSSTGRRSMSPTWPISSDGRWRTARRAAATFIANGLTPTVADLTEAAAVADRRAEGGPRPRRARAAASASYFAKRPAARSGSAERGQGRAAGVWHPSRPGSSGGVPPGELPQVRTSMSRRADDVGGRLISDGSRSFGDQGIGGAVPRRSQSMLGGARTLCAARDPLDSRRGARPVETRRRAICRWT